MDYKTYDYLCKDAVYIREEVFVKEQGFQDEFDEIDNTAVHLVWYEEDAPIATARYFKGAQEGVYIVGRIAIMKAHRGKGMGLTIMAALEEQVRQEGAAQICLSAQMQAKPFYEKAGYAAQGETYLEEHCEHVRMCKELA